jgi:hypothetical protein
MKRAILLGTVLAMLAACGPVHTAGTENLPANQLALLKVTKKNNGIAYMYAVVSHVTIDGKDYPLDASEKAPAEFCLTPAEHQIVLHFVEVRQERTLRGEGTLKFAAEAGASYAITASSSSAGIGCYVKKEGGGEVARGDVKGM